MTQEVYEVTIRGNEAALQALAALDNKAKQASDDFNKHSAGAAGGAKNIGDAFKSVSRDIDAVVGQAGSSFARWASDIYGVVEALGKGGVMGAAAGVSAAVGIGVIAWDMWNEHANKALKDAETSAEKARTAIQKINDLAAQGAAYQGGGAPGETVGGRA